MSAKRGTDRAAVILAAVCSIASLLAGHGSTVAGPKPSGQEESPIANDEADSRSQLLIGYTELRTNLPGGRHANVATRQACLVRADASGRRVLAEEHGQQPDSWTKFVGWSPDGRLGIIALGYNSPENAAWEEEHRTFRLNEGWLLDTCLIDVATGEVRNPVAVDRVSNYNIGLTFSPDNPDELTFLAMVDGKSRPYRMDADGRNKQPLGERTRGFTYGWNFSPDGQRVAYLDNYQLYLANADGSDVRRVPSKERFHFGTQWSPNGDWLLFLAGKRSDCHPHVARRDGTGLRKLADRNGYRGVVDILDVPDFHGGSSDFPTWSPDGQWVYYAGRVNYSIELHRVSLDGRIEQLTHSPPGSANYQQRVSPDGKWLVFGSNRTGIRQLYVMPAAGGTAQAITNVEHGWGAVWPSWQPRSELLPQAAN